MVWIYFGSVYGLRLGSYRHGSESASSAKGEKYLYQIKQLLAPNDESAPFS
jgi:hypothetical protein